MCVPFSSLYDTQCSLLLVDHAHSPQVRWSSPEVLSNFVFSQASDVWAYGIVLYEIATSGLWPYDDWSNGRVWSEVRHSPQQVITRHLLLRGRFSRCLFSCESKVPWSRHAYMHLHCCDRRV
jgi:serine/threonine protein kinase